MNRLFSMRDALEDPKLFGHPRIMGAETWMPWRALLIAAMGERLTVDERAIFRSLTGREEEPGRLVEELWSIIGRRGGKTRGAAVLSTYFACCVDHSAKLAPGEIGTIPVIAATTWQAGRAIGYIRGILDTSPLLGEQQAGEGTSDTIRFRGGVDIEVRPSSARTIRSMTAVAAICDEVAFWMTDRSVNPDEEILAALRPSLASTGGPLIVISSPHARKGAVFATYQKHYGVTGDPLILVAKAPSRTMNATLDERKVKRAYELDPAKAAAEYGAEFRSDIESCFTVEAVAAVTASGVAERGALDGVSYFAFVDPSGGSKDSMTLGIAHEEKGEDGAPIAVLDLVRERKPPFSPEAVVDDFCAELKPYRVTQVRGDRYAGEWPREQFRKRGIRYDVADKTRSEIYRDLIPAVNSRAVSLLDDERLTKQLVGLERRTTWGSGREAIDHGPGGHDDVANAAAGALLAAKGRTNHYGMISDKVLGDPGDYDRFMRNTALFGGRA